MGADSIRRHKKNGIVQADIGNQNTISTEWNGDQEMGRIILDL